MKIAVWLIVALLAANVALNAYAALKPTPLQPTDEMREQMWKEMMERRGVVYGPDERKAFHALVRVMQRRAEATTRPALN